MHAITDLNRSVAACQLGITVASLRWGSSASRRSTGLIQPALPACPPSWARVVLDPPHAVAHHLHARRLRRADAEDRGAAGAASGSDSGSPAP